MYKNWIRSNTPIFLSIAIIVATLLGTAYTAYAEYDDEAQNLLSQAQGIAVALTQDEHLTRLKDTSSGQQTATYQRLKKFMQHVNSQPESKINSMFLVGQRKDKSTFLYLGAGKQEGIDQIPVGTTYKDTAGKLREVFRTGQAQSYIERNEWGSWMTGAAPIILDDGTIAGVLTVYSSETELLHEVLVRVALPGSITIIGVFILLFALYQINRHQQAVMYQRSVFLASTSHDVRSPLRGILWALELIRNPKADRAVLIEKMERQLKYVLELVESVLNTVRADLELQSFKKESRDIIPLIQKSIESHELSAEQYGVKIETTLPLHLSAHIDKNLMREVINNLLSNAIKYTKENSVIHVKAGQAHGKKWFSIQDEGEGMTAEETAHLFEPFYRTEQAKSSGKPGTGMGLAMVKDIVKRHKGKIEVTSKPEKGSTFRVTLPK